MLWILLPELCHYQSQTVDDAPVCDAGDAQSVAEGATVTLDGTGSSDVESDTITYAWTVSAGTTQTVSNANTALRASQPLTRSLATQQHYSWYVQPMAKTEPLTQ